MRVAGDHAGTAVARDDVEVACRRMRPGILDVGLQGDRAPFARRGVGDVDIKEREFRSNAAVQNSHGHGAVTPRLSGCSDDTGHAGKQGRKRVLRNHHGLSSVTLWVTACTKYAVWTLICPDKSGW